jgi:Family of unknown function (DUF5677)
VNIAMKLLPYFEDRFNDNGKSKANHRGNCGFAAQFVTELLKFGDEAFGFCFQHSKKQPRSADHALLALARHTLAHLDSVGVLLANGCVDGCDSLLRSILEASLGITFIVEDKHEERALAYELARIKRKIKEFRRVDRNHPDGKALEAELSADAFVPGILSKLPDGLSKQADKIEAWLNAQHRFIPILAEWNRLKNSPDKKKQPDPEWFALFGGARDIRGLAKRLNRLGWYEFLYRDWSNSSHAADAIAKYSTADDCISPLRYPAGYVKVLNMAFVMFLNALELLTSFYDTALAEQFRKHTAGVMAPQLARLTKGLEKELQDYR